MILMNYNLLLYLVSTFVRQEFHMRYPVNNEYGIFINFIKRKYLNYFYTF